jgi:hypothetical protein
MLFGKKSHKYFAQNPMENAIAHTVLGIGIGFLLTYPMAASHPVRWGLAFILAGLAWHAYAMRQK